MRSFTAWAGICSTCTEDFVLSREFARVRTAISDFITRRKLEGA